MRRVLWWVSLAVLATICALIATAPVPPSDLTPLVTTPSTTPPVIYEETP